jgi:hypothetical protein
MIDHATFQVLDDVTAASSSGKETGSTPGGSPVSAGRVELFCDSVPACSGSHFPWPDHRSMSYRTKETLS